MRIANQDLGSLLKDGFWAEIKLSCEPRYAYWSETDYPSNLKTERYFLMASGACINMPQTFQGKESGPGRYHSPNDPSSPGRQDDDFFLNSVIKNCKPFVELNDQLFESENEHRPGLSVLSLC